MCKAFLLVTLLAQAAPADREATRRRLERILAEETDRSASDKELEEWKKKLKESKAGESRPEPPEKEETRREPDGQASSGGSGASGIGSLVMWTILILVGGAVVAMGIYSLVVWWREREAAPKEKPKSVGDTKRMDAAEVPLERRDPDEWLAEARKRAARGAFREALRFLLLATMEMLHRARRIDYERARTNRECLRAWKGESPAKPLFASLVDAFDFAWYGGRAVAAEDYAAAEDLARRIRAGAVDESVA